MFKNFSLNTIWLQRKKALNTLADIAATPTNGNTDLAAITTKADGYFTTHGLVRSKYQTSI